MSFALSGDLQGAVYQALAGDAALAAVVGTAVYDAVPQGRLPEIYVRLGSEQAVDASDVSGDGAVHRFTVSVITTRPGYADAKAAAGAITDVLHDGDLTLDWGHLVSLRFERATAKRIDGLSARQIDLRFRARVSS